jgi:TP901 family phage tail tape measure protein
MAGFLPPVVATLLADTGEYTAKMDEAQTKMAELGGEADATAGSFAGFATKASTAILGVGVALGAFAIDRAVKFNESMDTLQNATGMSTAQIKKLETAIFKISDTTGSSTADLATAMAAIEQAGIHGAKAQSLLNDAAKAALATNSNVIPVATSLVAIEGLQIAKHMSLARVTGIVTAASHDFEGGISGVATMLQGKVGAALANYHVGLKTSIELGSVFAKVGLPTRSISTFINGIGKLEAPTTVLSDTSGTLERGLSGYSLALKQADINQGKLTSDFKTGNLAGAMLYLKDVATETKVPLSEVMNLVFGTGGSSAASLIANSGSTLTKVTKDLQGAGGSSLNKAFTTASGQFSNQMKIIETNLENAFARLGLKAMPGIERAAKVLEDLPGYLESHPLITKGAADVAAALLAGALALKLTQLGAGIATAFGVTVEAGIAATIGAAIGAAVLSVLVAGTGNQIATGVKQATGGHWYDALTNVVGGIDNTMRNLTNDLSGALTEGHLHLGSIIQPKVAPTVGESTRHGDKKTTLHTAVRVHLGR